MSLPECYEDSQQYFEDVLKFLQQYQWIYKQPNTHLLVDKVFDNFGYDWRLYLKNISYDELINLALAKCDEDAPPSLKLFFDQIKRLTPETRVLNEKLEYNFPHNSKLSLKKQHEILSLSPLIHKICQYYGGESILDIGTGLGYLPNLLHDKYGYKVLGIDCNENYIKTATNTNLNNDSLKFVHHFINDESLEFLTNLHTSNLLNSTCIVGLHACADLSIVMLDLFCQLPFAKCLVIMPCCYHRLQISQKTETTETFKNFPISTLMKSLESKYNFTEYLKTPFMRLSCQNRINDPDKLLEHILDSKKCLYRSILQSVAEEGNQQVERIKRKTKLKNNETSDSDDFEDYLKNLKNTHKLSTGNIDDEQFLNKMREKWLEHKDDCYLIESLTAFQVAIQSMCENIVLLDRLTFLMEKGIDCWIEKVTEESVSPRCYAIVAVKR